MADEINDGSDDLFTCERCGNKRDIEDSYKCPTCGGYFCEHCWNEKKRSKGCEAHGETGLYLYEIREDGNTDFYLLRDCPKEEFLKLLERFEKEKEKWDYSFCDFLEDLDRKGKIDWVNYNYNCIYRDEFGADYINPKTD